MRPARLSVLTWVPSSVPPRNNIQDTFPTRSAQDATTKLTPAINATEVGQKDSRYLNTAELHKLPARGFRNACAFCVSVCVSPFKASSFLSLKKRMHNKCNQDDGRCTLSVNTGVIIQFLPEASSMPLSQKTDNNRSSVSFCTPLNSLPLLWKGKKCTDIQTSEVCQPRCVWKTNSEVSSVRKHNYNCMLDDGIY